MTKAIAPGVYKPFQRDPRRVSYRVKVPATNRASVSTEIHSLLTETLMKQHGSELVSGNAYVVSYAANRFFELCRTQQMGNYTVEGMASLLYALQCVVNDEKFSEIYIRLGMDTVALEAIQRHGLRVPNFDEDALYRLFQQWVRHPSRLLIHGLYPPAALQYGIRFNYKAHEFAGRDTATYRISLRWREATSARKSWNAPSEMSGVLKGFVGKLNLTSHLDQILALLMAQS